MQTILGAGETLTAVLSGAITTSNPTYCVQSSEGTQEGQTCGSLSGVTAVTLATGLTNRIVKSVLICNIDTVYVIVTLKKVVGSTSTTLMAITLQPGEILTVDERGINVTDSAGQLKSGTVPALVYGSTGYTVQCSEVTFTETAGAGVYTGSVTIPAGATISDIIVAGVALWNNAGTATLEVGDVTDPDGYFTGVNLKATDLLAGESLSFAMAGGKAGAYVANSQVSPQYAATARVISGIVTTSSTGGSTGRTRMMVMWCSPSTSFIAAATKV